MRCHIPALALITLLAGCGGTAAPIAETPGAPVHAAADATKEATPTSPTALKPGQSVQGSIEADIGKGSQAFRSLSTRVADDIGRQVDAGLAAGKGERALADANRRLAESGVQARVDADQVRDLVESMAGKTFHDSSIQHLDITRSLNVALNGTAEDGAKVTVNLRFDDTTEAFQQASVSYQPAGHSAFDRYETRSKLPVEVAIEQFEKNADGSYALVGSFRADNVPAAGTAKNLAQPTLASIHGRFRFDALPVRELKIGG